MLSVTMAEEKDGRSEDVTMSRKEKRKAAKKTKRQLLRREKASEHHSSLENSAELQEEAERSLREKILWEERDKAWLESRAKLDQQRCHGRDGDGDGGDDGEFVEDEGPLEIIWQENKIILKKKKIRVPKSDSATKSKVDGERPISNPLPPTESDHQSSSSSIAVAVSGWGLIESVTPQQVPIWGPNKTKLTVHSI